MSPHQVLALGVRLLVVWLALTMVQELTLYFLHNWHSPEFSNLVGVVIGFYVIAFVILLVLWRFPKSIANGLLPPSTDLPTEKLSYQKWFALGTALLGLWFLASNTGAIVHNLAVIYIYEVELTPKHVSSLKLGIFSAATEVVIGLCLLFGANGIARFVWWTRRAGRQESGTEA